MQAILTTAFQVSMDNGEASSRETVWRCPIRALNYQLSSLLAVDDGEFKLFTRQPDTGAATLPGAEHGQYGDMANYSVLPGSASSP